ncbi:MAG TPA: hypothetical protein VEW48_15710 [Thermoanaerobaculia bacterium]|nr:hypothetical protein [Thermoanaerobaculia bacterium]
MKKKGKRRHVPKITRSVLERVRLAPTNRYFIMEGGGIDSLRGFGLEVGRAEVKYVIRKEGFPQVRLGLIHELTPEEAREQAAEKLRDMRVAKGKSSTMTGLRLTIEELALRYHEANADKWTAKTIEEYERLWRLHLLPHVVPESEHRIPLSKLKLPDLTPARVVALKRDIAGKVKAEAQAKHEAQPRRGRQVSGTTVANRGAPAAHRRLPMGHRQDGVAAGAESGIGKEGRSVQGAPLEGDDRPRAVQGPRPGPPEDRGR